MSKHKLDNLIFSKDTTPIERLKAVVSRLRDPDGGCPWDLEQTHDSLTPYVIEEAFEVVEAIYKYTQNKNTQNKGTQTNNTCIEALGESAKDLSGELSGELGDLLLQVVLHSQLAAESQSFTFDNVCEQVSAKLIKRHPHVFGDVEANTSSQVLKNWEEIKQKELPGGKSILDGVPRGMPALLRAQRVSEKAARVGFEWASIREILDKVKEEFNEFSEEINAVNNIEKPSQDGSIPEGNLLRLKDELGDIFFAVTQVARRLKMNSEDLLHAATDKFSRRFKEVERRVSKDGEGRGMREMKLEELDRIWEEVKREEKGVKRKRCISDTLQGCE